MNEASTYRLPDLRPAADRMADETPERVELNDAAEQLTELILELGDAAREASARLRDALDLNGIGA